MRHGVNRWSISKGFYIISLEMATALSRRGPDAGRRPVAPPGEPPLAPSAPVEFAPGPQVWRRPWYGRSYTWRPLAGGCEWAKIVLHRLGLDQRFDQPAVKSSGGEM